MIQRVSRFLKNTFLIFSLVCGTGQLVAIHATGLPSEYLSSQHWQSLFLSNTPVANPALMNEANYSSLRFVYSPTLGVFNKIGIGAVMPIGLYQSAGLTFFTQGVKTYEETDDSGDVTGAIINDKQYYFMGSYAYNLWAGLTLGINVNMLMYPFNNNAMGFGADLGLTYRLLNNPVIGTHLFGVSVQNLFMAVVNSTDKYPRNLRVSLNSTYWERRIESGFDFNLKDIGVAPSEFAQDSTPKSEWDINAKIGFSVLKIANLYLLGNLTEEGFNSMGFALSGNFLSMNNGRDLSGAYQYMTSSDPAIGGTHSIYVKVELGKHREEVYARKMAKLTTVSPNNLYLQAVELYSQGNYWDAFFLFSQLSVEFPDFFKNDWVNYFMGSCQEELDMRQTAEEAYQKTKGQFSRSAVVPSVDLGLMRVYYRDNNNEGIDRQFNELNKLGVPDSIKYHGYYLMGQAEMKRGNHSKAKQLFELIPDTHPDYVFAQHSCATANALADNIDGAVSNLENCIQAPVKTNSQKEIVNRSYVFLGYIFYEELTKQEGTLAKAVTALRMVPKNSYYYTDALLGLGWTGLKARQWNDCMAAGSELASLAGNTVLKAEGTLLQAYANMMQKNYAAAADLLAGIASDLEKYQAASETELSLKKQDYDNVRSKYTEIARSAYDLSTARQSQLVQKSMDSLHTLQKQYKDEQDKFIKYSDEFQRNSFFNRSLETVKEDIDYALAKAQKQAGASGAIKKSGEIEKKTDKIDDELEKLKKQLEEEQNKEE